MNKNLVIIGGPVYNIKKIESKSGKAMVSFTIASYSYKGEGKDQKVQFHQVVAYGKSAEIILQYVTEKRKLLVEGELDYYKDSNDVSRTQIIMKEFSFADGNPNQAA